jgi:6-phosphogluconolactonase (cycloisomerase 2 family)
MKFPPVRPTFEGLEVRQLLSAGDLTFLQTLTNGSSGVTGLGGAVNLAVSPDGKQVYVASVTDNAVTVLNRDSGGNIAVAQVLKDGVDNVDGLGGAITVAVSPDGKNVYVGGSTDDAIAVFARDAAGQLSFQQDLFNNPGVIDGLDGIRWLTLSPDGREIYAASNVSNSLAVFTRDQVTGQLTFAQSFTDGTGGVDGLASAYAVTVSPDGKNVYTAGYNDDGVGIFSRDADTGLLTYQAIVKQGDTQGSAIVAGLTRTTNVALSPDGHSVYVSSFMDNAVVLFNRDSGTGALTFQHAYANGADGITAQHGVYNVIVSPDSETVYATSDTDKAINVFTRDTTTGTLTFQNVVKSGTNNVTGLNGVFGLALSPDSHSLYAAARTGGTVTAFDRAFHVDLTIGNGQSLFFHDADGSAVTVTLAGGTADVRMIGRGLIQSSRAGRVTVTGAGISVDKIALSNTTLASKLVFTTSGGTTVGTAMGALEGSQPLGLLSASNVDLLRTLKMSGSGYVRTVLLRNLSDNSKLQMDGGAGTAGTSITAGTINAAVNIQLACPLVRLTAVKWTSGQLNAPTADSILMTGRPTVGTAAAVVGNMVANIVLDQKDRYGVSLYLLSVAGTYSGNITAAESGQPAARGAVRSIRAGAWSDGTLQASDLTSLYVPGQVGTVTLHAAHSITSIYAGAWSGGTIDAPTLQLLRLPGRAAIGSSAVIAGDLGGNVTSANVGTAIIAGDLTGDWTSRFVTSLRVGGDINGAAITFNAAAGTAGQAVRVLTVGGSITDSTMTSNIDLGSITAGGMSGSKLLVGVVGTDMPTAADDFAAAHPAAIGSLLIRGLRDGTTWHDSFANSVVAAWNLGRITLTNVDTSNGTTTFGIVGHSLTSYLRMHSGELWTSTGGAVQGPDDAAASPLVVEHAGDFKVVLVPVAAAG